MSANSALTLERPDIWDRALNLATRVTGCIYLPKLPLEDGTVTNCGGYPLTPDEVERQRERWDQREREETERRRNERERLKRFIPQQPGEPHHDYEKRITEIEREVGREPEPDEPREPDQPKEPESLNLFVPEGAMEWLLHEVGHWIAAAPSERLLPNYGYGVIVIGDLDAEREWEAFAFEDIIFSPFGPSRTFIPPSQRGGAAAIGRIPPKASHHVDQQLTEQPLDIAEWRSLYSEWVSYELRRRAPSWSRTEDARP